MDALSLAGRARCGRAAAVFVSSAAARAVDESGSWRPQRPGHCGVVVVVVNVVRRRRHLVNRSHRADGRPVDERTTNRINYDNVSAPTTYLHARRGRRSVRAAEDLCARPNYGGGDWTRPLEYRSVIVDGDDDDDDDDDGNSDDDDEVSRWTTYTDLPVCRGRLTMLSW